jgi:hypothetical protein
MTETQRVSKSIELPCREQQPAPSYENNPLGAGQIII